MLIPSFSVDHTQIVPGIYESRIDVVNGISIVTYDIRMKYPNKEAAISVDAMHSIEHLVATYLRNNKESKDILIYWGPMGCMTGSYMITKGRFSPQIIKDFMIGAMQYVINYEGDVPGTDITQCGNYKLHNLKQAKIECKQYLNRLNHNFCCEYPVTERKSTKEGDQFYDS